MADETPATPAAPAEPTSGGEPVVKAYVLEVPNQTSNASPTTEDDTRVFQNYGAIIPPYDPRMMNVMAERSAWLRPNVEVYKTNIEGFGHRLEPTIDPDGDDIDEHIQDAVILRKLADDVPIPTASAEEVAAEKLTLASRIRIEALRLSAFFENATGEISFVEFRERTRHDLEITGNFYWEVLRDKLGRPAQLVLLPSVSMRLLRVGQEWVEVEESRRISAIELRPVKVKRRLRLFVQVLYGQFVAYFKELGDPRIISARSGKDYPTLDALNHAEPGTPPATEVLHGRIFAPTTAYGVPRWIGATLAVLGSRSTDEVNVTYFDNKAIPPLAILVSGGVLAKGAADRITRYVEDNIKGRDNFHSILVLEAESASGSLTGMTGSRVRIDFKNLSESNHQDALFQQYDQNNGAKVGAQFRLPKILRGDMADFNRATADAALDYAEQQVFAPERNKIDHIINRQILPLLGASFHRFVSNPVQTKDPGALNEMITADVESGVLTPNEGRELVGGVYGRVFPKLDAPWADQPFKLSLAEASAGTLPGGPPKPDAEAKGIEAAAARLIQLRAALVEAEGRVNAAATDAVRAAEAEQVHYVPQDEFNSWFEPKTG